jgi:LacI family transcriptional regulator
MPVRPQSCRITILDNLAIEEAYELARGVIDYKRQSPHWQFVGTARGMFTPSEDVNPDEVDGVIGWLARADNAHRLMAAGIQTVSVAREMADPSVVCVASDVEAIGRVGAEYLIERGFTQFGFAAVPSTDQRVDTFRKTIKDNAKRPCHVHRVHWKEYRERGGSVSRWLADVPKPIAIMATDDRIGRHLIDRAVELGFDVPGDVAVLGVRNDRWVTEIGAVSMSSVQEDDRRIGYRAAMVLDGLLAGEAPPPPQRIPPLGVVTRSSTDIVKTEDAVVGKALRYIEEHCAQSITVENVLDHVDVSRRTLENRMKRAIGHTPKAAISRAVVRMAKRQLVETDATIGQIARACGFDRQEHFGVLFKNQTGVTPGQYRQQQQHAAGPATSLSHVR